jgi:parallel beta-helix repeat protein
MKQLLVFSLLFASCPVLAQSAFQKDLQTRLILAEDGDTLDLPEGTYSLDATLSLEGKKSITIRGKGMDRTILSFKGQSSGAEGLRVSNAENILLSDFSVEDAKGDAVKTMEVRGITFRNIRTAWTGKLSKHNGAYGLYPVLCENVLIEGCEARGASDAGIYVGQSKHIIVRRCKAYENVAGIEIENSLHAEVYENEAYDNTGGILVFDLPDLKLKKGGHCKVYNNIVRNNNTANFAPKGNIVGKVPQGTGILLLAANHVEVFQNKILNNRTIQTGIISYYITENPIRDSSYYPYPTAITVRDNVFEKEKRRATMKGRIGQLYRFKLKFGRNVPDIVYDGIRDKQLLADGQYPKDKRICVQNNGKAGFADIDAGRGFKNISRDLTPYQCL